MTQKVIILCLVALFVLVKSSFHPECACSRPELCKPAEKTLSSKPEVYVFDKGTTNIHLWRWSTIDAVIIPSKFEKDDLLEAETMCFTHLQKKKYGITVVFNVKDDIPGTFVSNSSKMAAQSWRIYSAVKELEWHADIVTIDLLEYFRTDEGSDSVDHAYLASLLVGLRKDFRKDTQVLCVVPWKPPCTKKDPNSCDFVMEATEGCNYFVISPDSFLDTTGGRCIASANIPLSKLTYGISEYIAHHIPSNRLIAGVTWHGYDYTCSSLINNRCEVKSIPTNENSTCNLHQRKRVTYGDLVHDHTDDYFHHERNDLYSAPFMNYKVGGENHQLWFEDEKSLKQKYDLVHELNLKGIGIFYGDDLFSSKPYKTLPNEELMWTWLSHEMLLKWAVTKHTDLHWADTVAGVAVGCFVLGALLGVIFTCLSMQRRVRKPRSPPFQGDQDPLSDEFTDDPNL